MLSAQAYNANQTLILCRHVNGDEHAYSAHTFYHLSGPPGKKANADAAESIKI
jgi:hypothetical protein